MRDAALHRRWAAETVRLMPTMERHAVSVHRLGARVALELMLELGAEHDIIPEIAARLADYAALSPEAVRLTGAGRMVPRRLMLAVDSRICRDSRVVGL